MRFVFPYQYLKAFELLDTNHDDKLQVSEIQAVIVFDQNKDGVVSEDEAKFFLHMESEMEKNEFLSFGWALMKPYFESMAKQLPKEESSPPDVHQEEQLHDVNNNKLTSIARICWSFLIALFL